LAGDSHSVTTSSSIDMHKAYCYSRLHDAVSSVERSEFRNFCGRLFQMR